MKILMLGWELPPHNSGGLGVACYQLCKALAAQGADIDFILPYKFNHDIDFMRVEAALPYDVSKIPAAGLAYDSQKYQYRDGRLEWNDLFGQQFAYEQAVGRLVEHHEFDVIHAHDWLTFRAALRAKELTGRPLIAHVHSVESDRAGGQPGNALVSEIEYQALMVADQIIAVSQHTKDSIMHDYDIPAAAIQVVHNSIDANTLESTEPDNAYRYLTHLKSHGYKVVTNVGRLTIQKGLPNFLQAARAVIDKAPKTIFLIVGDGDQYFELIQLAAELGISRNVILTGFQRGKRWRDAYAIADLFVLPSVSEPFGLTPLEAIGYGSPALVSKQSGVAEVLYNVLKVDYWDVQEMANQIISVVSTHSLGVELHRNAYREFAGMSWHQPAAKIKHLYDHHVAGAKL